MNINEAILKAAKKMRVPNGVIYKAITLQALKKIASKCRCSLRETEIAALNNNVIPLCYQRNIGTIGIKGQAKLLSSHVAIIGAGGLGGTVLEILARFGTGKITIADFDTFEESNLNRQLLSNTKNLKSKKTKAAVERVKSINPAVEIKAFALKLTDKNASKILADADIAADCLGGLKNRFVLEKAAKKAEIPLVHAALAGFTGQLTCIFPEDRGLELIYGPPSELPDYGSEAQMGTPPTMVFFMASWQAHEIIKILLNLGESYRDEFLRISLNDAQIKHLQLPKG
jgi:molybdopterin/thiamine biosynthesis adenylyltransferase